MVSLNDCQTANRALLGRDFRLLGRKQGGLFNGHKYMLAYTDKAGFKIEKLSTAI